MSKLYKEHQNNLILNQLVSENCLSFGRSPKLNNRKITHYLSGTRQKVDIFNFYEMRYLLLKVYPLIHNLFLQQRLNLKKKKKRIFEKISDFEKNTKKLPKQLRNWKTYSPLKNKLNNPLRGAIRPLLPKILFATTTPIYSSIIVSAAKKCHMPFHVERWLCGTITAGASYLDDFEKWSFLDNGFAKNISHTIKTKFFKNKKNITQQAKKIRKYQLGRKPSLIVIPDVSNNEMILKETNSLGIPVLGLVSSNCHNEIAYPIFANDLSIYSIHFFCHFLSVLILKEVMKNKHKLYLAPKRKKTLKFPQFLKEIFRYNERMLQIQKARKLKKLKTFQKVYIAKPYVFQGRYFLDNFLIRRLKIRKNWSYAENRKRRTNSRKKFLITPKKLLFRENQKRISFPHKSFVFKKHILLKKMQLINKLHHFNFPKITRRIRIGANKPRYRFWKQNKFFFSTTLRFTANTSVSFQFQRFKFRKFRKTSFWKKKKRLDAWEKKNRRYYKNKKKFPFVEKVNVKSNVKLYRKKWSSKQTKKRN